MVREASAMRILAQNPKASRDANHPMRRFFLGAALVTKAVL